MSTIQNIVNKYSTQYMSRKVVFAIDLFVSFLSSCFALLAGGLLSDSILPGSATLIVGASAFVFAIISQLIWGEYRIVIRHSNLRDLSTFFYCSLTKALLTLATCIVLYGWYEEILVLSVIDIFFTTFVFVAVRFSMILLYDRLKLQVKAMSQANRTLVYGTSDKAISLVSRLQSSVLFHMVGFITPDKTENGLMVSDYPVFSISSVDTLVEVIDKMSVSSVIVASERFLPKNNKLVVEAIRRTGAKCYVAPDIDELDSSSSSSSSSSSVYEITIENLLCRDEIVISYDRIMEDIKGKTVMVTGAAGSIGSQLCRLLASFKVGKLILFDNGETPMHNLRLELEEKFPRLNFVPVVGDVREVERVNYVFNRWHPLVVFHAAAYKHVPLMEENPCEAIQTNVYGTKNIADKCVEYGVEKMVMISTDKAVNPTNIMGCSKRIAEMYVQSLSGAIESGEQTGVTLFVTTRFGNVLGSNGSVVPRFREQIAAGGPVTVTHPDITRYFMTIPEACRLVLEAATMSTGNQIYVFDMGKPVKIDTLARKMIELAGYEPDKDIKIIYTGLRPGEKLYEELLADDENTIPTVHDSIRIAKVREYSYSEVKSAVEQLMYHARRVEVTELVTLMKKYVPEFISNNSIFTQLD